MKYRYKNYEFETDCKFVRVNLAKDYAFEEVDGVAILYLPPEIQRAPVPTFKIKEVELIYNGAKFRRKNLESVSLNIVKILDFKNPVVDETPYYTTLIMSHDMTNQELLEMLNGDNFEHVEGDVEDYREVLDTPINKSVTITGHDDPINEELTRGRYLLDFTRVLDQVYQYFEDNLKEKFDIGRFVDGIDPESSEQIELGFDQYATDYNRLRPDYNNELTQYEVPMTLKLYTASVGKFERLLADINALKYITNINKITVQDAIGRNWSIPLMWDPNQITTNSSEDTKNSGGRVSYEISLRFKILFFAVRSDKYRAIEGLLGKWTHDENTTEEHKAGNYEE